MRTLSDQPFSKLCGTALIELSNSMPKGQPVYIVDPTIMPRRNVQSRDFYYELKPDGSGYYLLGVGADGLPFTSDDLLPNLDTRNTGLLINPSSKPKP